MMKPLIVFTLFLSFNTLIVCQEQSFLELDAFAQNFDQPYQSAEDLAMQLTNQYSTELEKARVIFGWIVSHVRYDCKKFHDRSPVRIVANSKEELERKKLEREKELTQKAVKNQKGVCEDYSRLFKAMCEAVGLEAEIITGVARDFHRPYRSNHNNRHAWNAVKIDGNWHLLDATWGAGYTDGGVTKFKRYISMGYFMTTPDWFIQNHLPEDPQWQLLSSPKSNTEFASQPLVHYGQKDFPIKDFSSVLVKSKKRGYDLELRIKFEKSPKYFALSKQNSRPVAFDHSVENGYDVFRFSKRGLSSIILFGSDSQRKMGWLAMYEP